MSIQIPPPFLRSAAIRDVISLLQPALTGMAGAILYGEPGSGRTEFARAIHHAADVGGEIAFERLLHEPPDTGGRPFVTLDCSLPRDCETLLFGDIAWSDRLEALDEIRVRSRLHLANGGTLHLRHVHDMPTPVQVRLGRTLSDGEVVLSDGEDAPRRVRLAVRIIASADPVADIHADDRLAPELRRRLPHRVQLPPLRGRREDIPGLVRALLAQRCAAMHLPAKVASRQAMAVLCALPWPGNLAELRGVIDMLVLHVPERLVKLEDVLRHVRLTPAPMILPGAGTLKEARERFEREYVAAVLQQHRGRMAAAAKTLGIQRTNLYRKVRQLAVERRSSRH